MRSVHPFPSEIVQSIPASSTCFAKLDATHGYFQLPLKDQASALTTFLLPILLPSGQYSYLPAPMGLLAYYNERFCHSDRVVEGRPTKKIVDILFWAPNITELENRVATILKCCSKLNVTNFKSEFKIGDRLPFAGFFFKVPPQGGETIIFLCQTFFPLAIFVTQITEMSFLKMLHT